MRCIFVGIEYAGKSTLINLLKDYYAKRRQPVHMDDHFTIPDSTLSPASREQMVNFPDDVKERMQRMQIQYHVEVIRNYAHVLISGWHIEESIYSEFYGNDPGSPYYPNFWHANKRTHEALVHEARVPDIVLVHVTASDDAIRERMASDPHEYEIIREADIGALKRRFEEECDQSLLARRGRIDLDTTDRTPRQSLDELLLKSEPMITPGELAIRTMEVPDGDYEVVYENGVRKTVPVVGDS